MEEPGSMAGTRRTTAGGAQDDRDHNDEDHHGARTTHGEPTANDALGDIVGWM
jgi:hypothetical protein